MDLQLLCATSDALRLVKMVFLWVYGALQIALELAGKQPVCVWAQQNPKFALLKVTSSLVMRTGGKSLEGQLQEKLQVICCELTQTLLKQTGSAIYLCAEKVQS